MCNISTVPRAGSQRPAGVPIGTSWWRDSSSGSVHKACASGKLTCMRSLLSWFVCKRACLTEFILHRSTTVYLVQAHDDQQASPRRILVVELFVWTCAQGMFQVVSTHACCRDVEPPPITSLIWAVAFNSSGLCWCRTGGDSEVAALSRCHGH